VAPLKLYPLGARRQCICGRTAAEFVTPRSATCDDDATSPSTATLGHSMALDEHCGPTVMELMQSSLSQHLKWLSELSQRCEPTSTTPQSLSPTVSAQPQAPGCRTACFNCSPGTKSHCVLIRDMMSPETKGFPSAGRR